MMWPFTRAQPSAAPEPQAVVSIATQPIAVNLVGQDRIDQAKHRLRSIIAHLEQHDCAEQKLREFWAEARQHLVGLSGVGALANAEYAAVKAKLQPLFDRFGSL